MERIREARRATVSASNGQSRRRHRSSTLRDLPEEDGQVEFQETMRLRDRVSKKDSDRDREREHLNRSKRRRGDSFVQEINRGEGEESSEVSVDDEEDEEDGEDVARALPPTQATLFSMPNHGHQKNFQPAKVVRQAPAWKVTEEMIGVPVPRKARSASAKRSHEYWVSGGGSGEEQSHRQALSSPARRSIEVVSPSSSNASAKKKMKPIVPKTRPPKVVKTPSSIQNDIEIEVAEVLFGLMRQSQCSNKQESTENSVQQLDICVGQDAKPGSSSIPFLAQPSNLPSNDSPCNNSLPHVAMANQNLPHAKHEEENSAVSVHDEPTKVDSQQPAKLESSSPKLEKTSGYDVVSCEVYSDLETAQAAAVTMDLQVVVKPESDLKPPTEEAKAQDGLASKENSSSLNEEPVKFNIDNQELDVKKVISGASQFETKQEVRFEIDLMAPPPMAPSPDRDGSTDLVYSDLKLTAQDTEMKIGTPVRNEEEVDKFFKKEGMVERAEEKKGDTIGQKVELSRSFVNGGKITEVQGLKQQQLLQPKTTVPKAEKTAQSSSLALPVNGPCWAGSLPPPGRVPPLRTFTSMEGSTGSSSVLQPPHFLSQPRPKRCTTHQYIARNIYYHQQFMKMNNFCPAGPGSASVYGTKTQNANVTPSAENMVKNPFEGGLLGGKMSSVQDKGQPAATNGKEKNSEAVNLMDTVQRKQLVFQQASQPVPAGNLLHGPAFIFPLNHQAAAATATQSGPPKSSTSSSNISFSTNSAIGVPGISSALPAMATAMSFNYPNMPANDAPYLAILPNGGYPFPISTHVGAPPAVRGTHGQAMPFFNGSLYPSQVFHPSQIQHQQHPTLPPVQPAHQNTGPSSTSQKQSQGQQQQGMQVSGSSFLNSANLQLMQLQKQQVPLSNQSRKLENEVSGEHASSAIDGQASTQKNVCSQNLAVNVQPFNFALMSSATLAAGGSSNGGNHGEKQQQQSQQQGSKIGVELIPSQPFAMSFASFNGSSSASGLNFSSMAQNPAIFGGLPDMAQHGYQFASASQTAQQKNYRISEGKTGSDLINREDGRKSTSTKSSSVGQTLAFSKTGSTDPSVSAIFGTSVFDSSARTLSFMSSPVTANWPSRSINSTTITSTTPVVVNAPNAQQQQQLLQLQQLHVMQRQPAGMVQLRAPSSSSQTSSPITGKFPNNSSVFSQAVIQSNSPAHTSQWKTSARASVSQVPSPSVVASSNSVIKNFPQQLGRAPQGYTQISFGGNHKSGTLLHGQQIPINNHSSSSLVAVSPPACLVSRSASGSLKSASTSSKAGPSIPALPSQQSENSTGTSQKSSPVCGRNVPSILSTCPSHLSELKY